MDFNNYLLTDEKKDDFLIMLQTRFEKNHFRHKDMNWELISQKLNNFPMKLQSLYLMEQTGGEPDVLIYDSNNDEYIFFDCSAESPTLRRSLCYDKDALDSRKENKPISSAIEIADEMGIELLNEEQYFFLQNFGKFDTKTSSWIKTPDNIRILGGALFGDYRFGRVFIYHNGAQSYYSARGFRAMLRF